MAIPYYATLYIKNNGLYPEHAYSFTLLAILPFIQGIYAAWKISGYKVTVWRATFLILAVYIIDSLVAAIQFKEGYLCLLMAMPLYVSLIIIGAWIGKRLLRIIKGKTLHSSLIPLVMVAVVYDTQNTPPDFANAISDAVTIQAPPEVVWKYIVQYPENTKPPEYWLWQIGLPAPIQSIASDEKVGAERECRFTNNIAFKEKITELTPGKVLTFDVTAQPDHPEIIGHFKLDKGQLYLEKNPDGSTTVIATSWYRIYVRPATYFDLWASDIVRNVHMRVLGHIKALAEQDVHRQDSAQHASVY